MFSFEQEKEGSHMTYQVGFTPYTKFLEIQKQFDEERRAINVLYGEERKVAEALIAEALASTRFEQYVDAVGRLTEKNVRILKNDDNFWSLRRVDRIESVGASACFAIITKNSEGAPERIEITPDMSILVETK